MNTNLIFSAFRLLWVIGIGIAYDVHWSLLIVGYILAVLSWKDEDK